MEPTTDLRAELLAALCALVEAGSMEEALEACLDGAIAVAGADCGGIYVTDPESGRLALAHHRGLTPEFAEAVASYSPECPNARVVRVGRPLSSRYDRFAPVRDGARAREGLRALAVVPILSEGEAVGCINVALHLRDSLPEGALAALETFAAAAGQAIVLDRLRKANAVHEGALAADRARRDEEARASLRALAAGVVHTVANIHTAVLLLADIARSDVPRGSSARQSLGSIVQTSQRATKLCWDLLAFSGRQPRKSVPVSLAALAAGAGRLSGAPWPGEVQLILRLEGSDTSVLGDPERLATAIQSLITNALEAHDGQPGSVRVSLRDVELRRGVAAPIEGVFGLPDGPCVALEVSDDGPGMDPETLRRACEPFFTTKLLGRGMGLAAADGIVRDHGGALRLASMPGVGTTATILLPASVHVH